MYCLHILPRSPLTPTLFPYTTLFRSACHLLLRLADNQTAKHAGSSVARQRTQVFKGAAFGGAKNNCSGGAPTRKLIGLYIKLWHGNVMNGTIAVDHVNLHYSVFRHPQIGVNLAFNLTGVADIHQFAVGNIGTQCKGNVRTVGDRVQRSVAVGSKSGRDKY